MVKAVLASSLLVTCYSNDLIDRNIMEYGKLVPRLHYGSPEKAIIEAIEIVRNDFKDREINVFLESVVVHERSKLE